MSVCALSFRSPCCLAISLFVAATAWLLVEASHGGYQPQAGKPAENQPRSEIAEVAELISSQSPLERLKAQESKLAAALRASLDSSELPLRERGRLDERQTELARKLQSVRCLLLRERVTLASDSATWEAALSFGEELFATYPGDRTVLIECARLRAAYASYLLLHHPAGRIEDYATVHRQLEWVDEHLPDPPRLNGLTVLGDMLLQSGRLIEWRYPPDVAWRYQPDVDALRHLLSRKAAELVELARKAKDTKTSEKRLQAALDIWPRMPGLRDELLKRQGKYAILNVGVRDLPRFLSPAYAVNDAEQQALDLVFESLIQYQPTSDGGLTLVPQLAASLPRMADNERNFLLRKTARWSSGARVTSADVQRTFEFLSNDKSPGHNAQLADQVEAIRTDDDPFRVSYKLGKGLLESLAPFTFRVLPRNTVNDEASAFTPIGSGPYMLAGTGSEEGRPFMRFVVNPHYMPATGSLTLVPETSISSDRPKIRELRFFKVDDPVVEFANKSIPLHLLLDVPTQYLAKLKTGMNDVRTLTTRRVYFLAVNNRDPLLADESLRRALAHAIQREQVLADCFAGGRPSFRAAPIAAWGSTLPVMAATLQPKGPSSHHPLNGLYPAGSWAVCPDGRVPKDLFDRARADTFLRKARDEGFDLELKYPDNDPRVQRACQAIAAQLSAFGDHSGRPIRVRLLALPPRQLQRDILGRRYQLAYWHHDFPDDSFGLWPLFDPREAALATGSNYLGFNDVSLTELLQKAQSFRDFREVKHLTHDIHALLFERMPLIPLWQLDYHLAAHPSLRLPEIDPMRVFANIGEWELKGN